MPREEQGQGGAVRAYYLVCREQACVGGKGPQEAGDGSWGCQETLMGGHGMYSFMPCHL